MSSNLKLALLGCGEIARFHLAGMREQAPRIDVTAAIDIDAERANAIAEQTGARAFATLDDALVGGTTGELTISSRGGGLWLWNASRRRGELLLQSGGYPKSFGGEMKDFAAAVPDGTPLKAGPEVSLGELRTALAIYRSAQTGAWESVWD